MNSKFSMKLDFEEFEPFVIVFREQCSTNRNSAKPHNNRTFRFSPKTPITTIEAINPRNQIHASSHNNQRIHKPIKSSRHKYKIGKFEPAVVVSRAFGLSFKWPPRALLIGCTFTVHLPPPPVTSLRRPLLVSFELCQRVLYSV